MANPDRLPGERESGVEITIKLDLETVNTDAVKAEIARIDRGESPPELTNMGIDVHQFREAMAGLLEAVKERGNPSTTELPPPENYVEPTAFPKFTVARLVGEAQVVYGFGVEYSFTTEADARAYIDFAREKKFKGLLRLVRFDTETHGKILEGKIEL